MFDRAGRAKNGGGIAGTTTGIGPGVKDLPKAEKSRKPRFPGHEEVMTGDKTASPDTTQTLVLREKIMELGGGSSLKIRSSNANHGHEP